MKTWEKRLVIALIALAFALLIYSYFTDREVFYSPSDYSGNYLGVDGNIEIERNKLDSCRETRESEMFTCEFDDEDCRNLVWENFRKCIA
ncbi:MAG: hypothetical protein AABW79_02235 [Nanoarchaeota archaeon]